MNSIRELVDYIKKKSTKKIPFLVGISGFAGSGKSTISRELSQLLNNATIIHVDDFIKFSNNGAKPNYPHDWYAIEELVLKRLHTGKVISRTYDWKTNSKVIDEFIDVTPIIIMEGIPAMFRPDILQYLDLKVWIDCPQSIANERGKKRDREEHKVDYEDLWNNAWIPAESKYYEENRPDRFADLTFRNN